MNDLTPEDRALLELARDGHEPSDDDRVRVYREKIRRTRANF